MLFVLAAVFEILNLTFVSQLLTNLLAIFFAYVPRLLAAGILALIAWVVARLGRAVVLRIAQRAAGRRAGDETGLGHRPRGGHADRQLAERDRLLADLAACSCR